MIYSTAVQEVFHRDFHPDVDGANWPQLVQRPWPYIPEGSSPKEQDRIRKRAGEQTEESVIRRRQVTANHVYTAKHAALRARTEEDWVRRIEAIEDDNLREAVAKKVYWDFFSRHHWRGLDTLVHSDPDCRIIKYFSPETAPEVEDIRIALWQLGYPVATIKIFYPPDTAFAWSTEQNDD